MNKHLPFLALTFFTQPLLAQDWSLTGNAGTDPATHFLGTTDNVPLEFRVNGLRSGLIDGTNRVAYFGRNVGVASTSFGQDNAAFGDEALSSTTHGAMNCAFGARSLTGNTTGGQNSAFGMNALGDNTTASSNCAFGAWSLDENSTGARNAAFGSDALGSNTVGSDNVAAGTSALAVNKAGSRAVAIGAEALRYSTGTSTAFTNMNVAIGYQAMHGSVSTTANTGNSNTAVGYQALGEYTTASLNTAIGRHALSNVTTASNNTGVGFAALANLTSGNNNTALGFSAGVATGALTNTTALGYLATVSTSNKVRLGNSSVTVVEGQVAYTSPSDARFKREVREDVLGLDLILKLRPVSYAFDRLAFAKHVKEDVEGREAELAQASTSRSAGFLAQEVEEVLKDTKFAAFDVVHVPEGPADNYGLAYAQFVVPLVKAVQELHGENEALKEELEATRSKLSERVAELEKRQGIGPVSGELHVFPVPVRDRVWVSVEEQLIGKGATVDLLDAAGRKVHHLVIASLDTMIELPLPAELPAGSYSVQLQVTGGALRSARVLIAR